MQHGRDRQEGIVPDWNVVASAAPEGYRDAIRILSDFGEVSKSPYRDVIVMRTALGARELLEALKALTETDKTLLNAVARLTPVTRRFSFSSADEFRARVAEALLPWAPELEGKTFFVRMHRRGFHEELNSQAEERAIGQLLVDGIGDCRRPARVVFGDPDIVIAVETVGGQGGVSRWTRADLDRYELLRFD
jgi:tRNA(Ser,Leu) C12 N-acetylase TAN1